MNIFELLLDFRLDFLTLNTQEVTCLDELLFEELEGNGKFGETLHLGGAKGKFNNELHAVGDIIGHDFRELFVKNASP